MITRQVLRDWNACYSDEHISALVSPEGLTPLQLLDLDIPYADRVWGGVNWLVREHKNECLLLLCKWARQACAVAGWTDPRSLDAIETTEKYVRGETAIESVVVAVRSAEVATADALEEAYLAAEAKGDDVAARAAARAAAQAAGAVARATHRTVGISARNAVEAARAAGEAVEDAQAEHVVDLRELFEDLDK